MYHKVFPESPTMWWVDVDTFYRQMWEIAYRKVVYLDDYDASDPDHVVITFDGVYRNVLDFAAPVLTKLSLPFELFVSGNYIGKDNSFDESEPPADFASTDDLKDLVKCGGRLQWHSRSHLDLGVPENERTIVHELSVPAEIRKLDPRGFRWFAYPNGKFSGAVVDQVKRSFVGAVSCHQGSDEDRYALNRITVTNEVSFKKAAVALVIPCYNYGHFLVEALESALRQTRGVDEIIIADDCSNDSTEEIGSEYQGRYPELIRYCRNEANLGVVENFNRAVSLTRAPYVCLLGADNRFRSDYVQKTAEILDADDRVGIAYTDFALFGALAEAEWQRYPEALRGPKKGTYYIVSFPDFDERAKKSLNRGNFIHGSSLYRRRAFLEVGGYRDEGDGPEDHSLFRRMIAKGWNAKRVPLPLLEYRQHSLDQMNVRQMSYAELHYLRRAVRDRDAKIRELQASLDRVRRSPTKLFYYTIKKGALRSMQAVLMVLVTPVHWLSRIAGGPRDPG